MVPVGLISTVHYDQTEILNAISSLYLDGGIFEVDPTYGRGNLYKSFPVPLHKFDIKPRKKGVIEADCRDLQKWLRDDSVGSIMFDPPFLIGGGKNGIMHGKYGTFRTKEELETFFKQSLHEFSRILRKDGILAVKCMDTVTGRRNYFLHVIAIQMAEKHGYRAEDLFVLVRKNRVMQWNMVTQQHARKFHSYFLVFRKMGANNIDMVCDL